MRVISRGPLREFAAKHPDAAAPLAAWWKVAQKARWSNIQDVRMTYPHADAVELANDLVVTVFNVGGNKYRLVTRIVYRCHLVYVKRVLTHKEYDRGNWKSRL
jgi:mRNA interferase HigB